jgi:hypothetical protein
MLKSFHGYNNDSCNSTSTTDDNNFLISDLLLPLHKEEEKTDTNITCFCCWFFNYFYKVKKV